MIGRWLVLNVGCLECHEPTYVVGTYDTREEALAATEGEGEFLPEIKFFGGDHMVLICDLQGSHDAPKEQP